MFDIVISLIYDLIGILPGIIAVFLIFTLINKFIK